MRTKKKTKTTSFDKSIEDAMNSAVFYDIEMYRTTNPDSVFKYTVLVESQNAAMENARYFAQVNEFDHIVVKLARKE